MPVVLVSARAGEEARIEGLDAGADDYIVKPFAARELVARVQAQMVRSRMRSLEEAHAARLTSIFEHTPVGVAILRGPTHVFEFANREYLGMVGPPCSCRQTGTRSAARARGAGAVRIAGRGLRAPERLMSVAPIE